MKKSPQEMKLEQNFGPSKFSGEGFLGNDTRPIDQIVIADLRALEETGVSKQSLVERLRDIFSRAKQSMGGNIEVREGCTAAYHESRGRIPSPFFHEGTYEKGEVVVTDSSSGETLRITSLGIHLIEAHDFFQGNGSLFRIDPRKAVRLLGLDDT